MNLQEIIDTLHLQVVTTPQDFSTVAAESGYVSDLLSCVMAGAKKNGIWVTLQAHTNIVAVAALLELSAVIITEGAVPDANTINKANQEGVTLLTTGKTSFYIAGNLWELGLREI